MSFPMKRRQHHKHINGGYYAIWLQHLKQRRRIFKQKAKSETIHRKICSLILFLFRYILKKWARGIRWGRATGGSIHQGLSCFLFIATDHWPATEYVQNKPSRSLPASSRISALKVSGREKIVHHILKHHTYKTWYKWCRISSWSHGDALLTADKLTAIHSGHVGRVGKRNVYIISIVKPTWNTFYSI
jgi:hypothetical protein